MSKRMQTSPNFTPQAQVAIRNSREIALNSACNVVRIEHLALAILSGPSAVLSSALRHSNINKLELIDFMSYLVESLRVEDKDFPTGEFDGEVEEDIRYASCIKEALALSFDISLKFGEDYISAEHLFLSLLKVDSSPLSEFLMALSGSVHQLYDTIVTCINASSLSEEVPVHSPPPPVSSNNLKKEAPAMPFSVNFNELALADKLSKVIGKKEEINRVCDILSRKTKNNPILIGEPGVGKSAIIEGLAQDIVRGKVATHLMAKTIYSIDIASMLAGTKYRGSFEDRLKKIIKKASNPNTILFIDEVHSIVGAGSSEGTLDAANILKQPLSRGDLTCVGATTLSEYKKHILKDPALARRFEPVFIEEPSPKEVLEILQGVTKGYESYHRVKFSQKCLREIVRLSDRFFPSQRFPAKAIDLLDEVGASLRNSRNQPSEDAANIYEIIHDFENGKITSSDAEALLEDYVDEAQSYCAQEDSLPFLRASLQDIQYTVSKKTRIPLSHISESQDNKILNITKRVSKSVLSQEQALNSISSSLCSSGLGLNNPNRPIGSFLFLGRTGVGKTFLATEVSRHFFGEKSLIRFNMSEFSEGVSVNKLVGSSPGYVGYEEGGKLIDKIRNNPHCVLLFDEIEKAHPSVLNLLLQILEDGSIEDGLGHEANLKNSIIILTGNIGSSHLDKNSLGFSTGEEGKNKRDKIIEDASEVLSPELINRLSDIIVFNELDIDALKKICLKELNFLKKSLKKKKVSFTFSEEVIDRISNYALKENLGARPIRRIIKKEIESFVIKIYLKSLNKTSINVDAQLINDKIVVKQL